MIQRVQTIYLFLAVAMSVVCLCLPIGAFTADGLVLSREYNLWLVDGTGGHRFDVWPLFAVLFFSAAIGVYTIFVYANRVLQARFCMFCIWLLVGWYVLYLVYARMSFGIDESRAVFSAQWPCVLPLVAIVFYFMARRAILADERLVRAADRIR